MTKTPRKPTKGDGGKRDAADGIAKENSGAFGMFKNSNQTIRAVNKFSAKQGSSSKKMSGR